MSRLSVVSKHHDLAFICTVLLIAVLRTLLQGTSDGGKGNNCYQIYSSFRRITQRRSWNWYCLICSGWARFQGPAVGKQCLPEQLCSCTSGLVLTHDCILSCSGTAGVIRTVGIFFLRVDCRAGIQLGNEDWRKAASHVVNGLNFSLKRVLPLGSIVESYNIKTAVRYVEAPAKSPADDWRKCCMFYLEKSHLS